MLARTTCTCRKLGPKKKPGIADGLILTLARRLGMKILTGINILRACQKQSM